MVVIYNDSFLEKLRRLDGLVTITSYAFLEGQILNSLTPEEILNLESSDGYDNSANPMSKGSYRYLDGADDLRAIWGKDTKKLKVCVNVPEVLIEDYENSGAFDKKEFLVCTQAIRFKYFNDQGKEEIAFVLINLDKEIDNKLELGLIELSLDRNLITIQLPEYTKTSLRAINPNADDMFLNSYASDLGKNLFTVSDAGDVHITRDSFYKYFGIKIHKIDDEAVPFVVNDVPILDEYGNKIEQIYTCREYTDVNIFCSGVDNNCWVPTKFDLYKNYIDGEIRLYGTVKYREFKVIGDSKEFIGVGEETLSTITGLYFEEVDNRGLAYEINNNHQTLSYELPETEDYNPNASVTLRAVVTKPNGEQLKSNSIRFMLGGKDDEWKLHSKTTDYTEPVNGAEVPVFLFPYDSTTQTKYKHQLVIHTSLFVEKKEDLALTLENKLSDYFKVDVKVSNEYELDNFKRSIITLTLKPKQENKELIKWYPLNEKEESELMLATISYNKYSTSFYMVQGPKVEGLKLYEFNSLGASFSAVSKIEFGATEKSRIYWMLTEEKTEPKVRPWWTSYTSKKNRGRGIKVIGTEYNQKSSFIQYEQYKSGKDPKHIIVTEESIDGDMITYSLVTKDEFGKVIKTKTLFTERLNPGRGLFTVLPKRALRPDIEVIGSTSSGYYLKSDIEMLPNLKYMTVFDSFSIDSNGYITLNSSKIVGNNGLVQADTKVGDNTIVGDVRTTETDLVSPITRTLSTYINNKNLGIEVSAVSYKSATINNSSQYVVDKNGDVVKREETVFDKDTNTSSSQNKLQTLVSTDGKLINSSTGSTSSYYFTKADVVGEYLLDRETAQSSGLTTAVNRSVVDTEQITASDRLAENTADSVIAFIREDGTIGYTSKSDGIAVKLVTDYEGKLVTDPRRIWNNVKLRPIIIKIPESPKDVRDIEDTDNPFDPITFYRVNDESEAKSFEDDDKDGKFPKNTWRNMVRRAQVTYAVNKKGQEPFIQIIGDGHGLGKDTKYKVYEDGRFATKIRHAISTDIAISYIKRNSFLVRSNCPFKLTIEYNKNYEGTLEFDKMTSEMKKYIISNDSQSLYCPTPKFDSILGSGVFINIMEADWTGVVGKMTASYGDLVESVNIVANEFSGKTEITEVDSDGRVLKGTNQNLVVLGPRESKNLYFGARRTLKAQFTSYRDTIGEDNEPIRVTTPDYCRVPIRYSSKSTPNLRISKISPRYDKDGYVNHGVTLDMEVLKRPKYPLDPVGRLNVAPYKTGFDKGAKYYIYNRGQEPQVKMDSSNYIGVLGGESVLDPSQINPEDRKMLNREITNITADNVVYNLNKWEDMEQVIERRIKSKRINGSSEDVSHDLQTINTTTENAARTAKMLPSATRSDYNLGKVKSYDIVSVGSNRIYTEIPVYLGYISGSSNFKDTDPYIKLGLKPGHDDTESSIYSLSCNGSEIPLQSNVPGNTSYLSGSNNDRHIIGLYLLDYDGFIFLRPGVKKFTDSDSNYPWWGIAWGGDHEVVRSLPIQKTIYQYKDSSTDVIAPKQYLDRISARDTDSILVRHVTNIPGVKVPGSQKTILPWHVYPGSPKMYISKCKTSSKGAMGYTIYQLSNSGNYWTPIDAGGKILSSGEGDTLKYYNMVKIDDKSEEITLDNNNDVYLNKVSIDKPGYSFKWTKKPDTKTKLNFYVVGESPDGNEINIQISLVDSEKDDPFNELNQEISTYGTLRDVARESLRKSLQSQGYSEEEAKEKAKELAKFYSALTVKKGGEDSTQFVIIHPHPVQGFEEITEANRLIYSSKTLSSSVSGGAVYRYRNNRWSPYYDTDSSGTTVILNNVKWPKEDQIIIKKHSRDSNNKIFWSDINLKDNTDIYGFFDTTGKVTDNINTPKIDDTLRFVQPTSSHEDNSIEHWYVDDVKGEDNKDVFLYTKIKGINTVLKYVKQEDGSISVWQYYEDDGILPVSENDKFIYYEHKKGKWNQVTDNRLVLYRDDKDSHFYYNLSPSGLKPADPKVVISITTNGLIKFVPIRWRNVATGSTVYTVPGAKIGTELLDSDVKKVEDIIYTTNNSEGLNDNLYIIIEDPILWSAVNTEEVATLKNNRGVTYFVSDSKTPLIDSTTLFTQDDYELTGRTANVVDLKKRMTFSKIAKYKTAEVLDVNNVPIKATYEYKLPYVSMSTNRNIIKSYETFIMLRGSTIPVQVIECDDKNKYIRRTNKLATYCPRIYTEKTGAKITKRQYKTEVGDSALNETTFTVLSRYRLQYPRIEEIGGKFDITSTPTKLFYQYDSDGKQEEIFDGVNIESKPLNEINGISDPETRGQEYSKALDVDINVNPVKENDTPLFRISNISESYDTEKGLYSYNITVIPKCGYEGEGRRYCGSIKITSRVREVFRDNANVPVDILNYYPKVLPLYNDSGKVIPSTGKTRPLAGVIYAGAQKRDDGRDVLDFTYESTILPENQNKLGAVIPEDSLTINVYQQKSNILQMNGDRSSEVVGDTNRIYTAMYQPGSVYPVGEVKLEPQSLKMYGEFLGWNKTSEDTNIRARFKTIYNLVDHWPAQIGDVVSIYVGDTLSGTYRLSKGSEWKEETTKPALFSAYVVGDDSNTIEKTLASLLKSPEPGMIVAVESSETVGGLDYYIYTPGKPKNVNISVSNYDPVIGTLTSPTGFSYPHVTAYFNSLLNSYSPETPKFYVGGLKSAYKDSDYPTKSILYRIEVGNWIPGSGSNTIDTGERFRPKINETTKLPDTTEVDGVTYVEWIREELSGKVGFSVCNWFSLLIPLVVDGQPLYTIEGGKAIPNTEYLKTLSISNPLDSNQILFVNKDRDRDDNYMQNVKHKYIVKYEADDDISWCKLWNTKSTGDDMTWTWNSINKQAYSEIVTYDLPGFNKGVVCATTKNAPKIYLGDSTKKNIVKEFVSGKETSIELFAGLFDLTSSDSVLRSLDKTTYYIPEGEKEKEIDNIKYKVYARYSGNVKSNKFSLLLPESLPEEITPSKPLIPNYVLWPDETYTEGFVVDGKNWAIVSRDGDKLYEYSNDGNIGTMDISIIKNDSITKDWSYEILSNTAVLDKETNEFTNNIRLTFPPNENDDTITRSFKIRATNPDNGVYHEVAINIEQGSYLGTINCEDNIRFYSNGEYYSGVGDDPYFYFDTDIPSSELEFTVNGDNSALPYLGIGDNSISAYGADFKRYRLSIKLSENFGKTKSIKTLVITRTYNLYDPSTGRLIPKKKVMKRVSLEQGYETIYLGNPSRLQDNILGKLDSDNPTPEFLTPGMISGSFFNPLLVPKNHSVPASNSEDGKRKVMNYTFQIYYEKCEPNEKGSFSTVKLTGKDLKDYVDEFSVSSEWRIYDDSGEGKKSWTIEGIFDNYGTQLIKSTSEDEKNYIAPCLYNKYETKEDFVGVNVRTYVVMTVNFQNKVYQYYAYMKKVDYDLVYPEVES